MLKKVMMCTICGSEKCQGDEWEIVPGDKEFAGYSRMTGSRNTFQICSSMVSREAEPTFKIVVGHGVSFVVRVQKKKLSNQKRRST
jgi:hypothetical protein